MISPFRQDRIQAAHVMVVGCGALGNEVLKNLVLQGISHLLIVDFDRVEPDNLTRSVLFTTDDARSCRYKVEAVTDSLRRMSPGIDVQSVIGDIAYDVGLGVIRQMDVVIGCVDNRWARYCINRLCMRAGKSWVDGGIDGLEGTVRVFVPGENCYACNLGPEGLRDMSYRMSCAGTIRRNLETGKSPTTAIAASVVGAVQVQEAMKLLHREELAQGLMTSLCGRMFYYEGQHLSTKTVAFKAFDEDCPEHEMWLPVRTSPLDNQHSVGHFLAWLEEELGTHHVHFSLYDDCFVDYVVRKDNDQRTTVMKPGHLVAEAVASHPVLGGIPFSGLYQNEYREIGFDFPYQDIALCDLGIPRQQVLPVTTEAETYYIALG